eukprot:TRINITY_DN11378_c0_g1_i3.p1 TRINITY_DN11378_c0_g1~~TRINITY_DN11378_c0_g1_i3.p1  ORF type:complete len:797 (+),score=185.13 TRINITY_DN11378_c0_g1_i3:110-2500(+)
MPRRVAPKIGKAKSTAAKPAVESGHDYNATKQTVATAETSSKQLDHEGISKPIGNDKNHNPEGNQKSQIDEPAEPAKPKVVPKPAPRRRGRAKPIVGPVAKRRTAIVAPKAMPNPTALSPAKAAADQSPTRGLTLEEVRARRAKLQSQEPSDDPTAIATSPATNGIASTVDSDAAATVSIAATTASSTQHMPEASSQPAASLTQNDASPRITTAQVQPHPDALALVPVANDDDDDDDASVAPAAIRTSTTTSSRAIVKRKPRTVKPPRPADESSMTMRHLIYYNPLNPRTVPQLDEGEAAPQARPNFISARQDPAANADEDDDDEPAPQPTVAAPQIKMVDGQLVVDDSSLVVQAQQASEPVLDTSQPTDNAPITYSSFGKRQYGKHWSVEETNRFYKALSMCGINFYMMLPAFPGRTHKQLKKKYRRESRANKARVDAALDKRQQYTPESMQALVAAATAPPPAIEAPPTAAQPEAAQDEGEQAAAEDGHAAAADCGAELPQVDINLTLTTDEAGNPVVGLQSEHGTAIPLVVTEAEVAAEQRQQQQQQQQTEGASRTIRSGQARRRRSASTNVSYAELDDDDGDDDFPEPENLMKPKSSRRRGRPRATPKPPVPAVAPAQPAAVLTSTSHVPSPTAVEMTSTRHVPSTNIAKHGQTDTEHVDVTGIGTEMPMDMALDLEPPPSRLVSDTSAASHAPSSLPPPVTVSPRRTSPRRASATAQPDAKRAKVAAPESSTETPAVAPGHDGDTTNHATAHSATAASQQTTTTVPTAAKTKVKPKPRRRKRAKPQVPSGE